MRAKMMVGDIIWQSRMPGGECLLIEIWHTWEEYKEKLNEEVPDAGDPVWNEVDFPVLRVLHPTEGLLVDPSYYYDTLADALAHAEEEAQNESR